MTDEQKKKLEEGLYEAQEARNMLGSVPHVLVFLTLWIGGIVFLGYLMKGDIGFLFWILSWAVVGVSWKITKIIWLSARK